MKLLTEHLDYLRKSGLSDSMIEKMQCYSSDDAEHLHAITGRQIRTPALVVPYFDFHGNRLPDSNSSVFVDGKKVTPNR